MTAAIVALGPEVAAGAEAAAGAGAAEGLSAGESAGLGRMLNLGGGHRMWLNEEQFRELLHHPIVVEAITERAQGVADECNETKVKKRAVYEVLVQNRPGTTRARAFVRPANADAFHDDAIYSTMLKAAANAPSDPKVSASAPTEGGGETGAAAGEAAGAEGAVAAEGAEVAEVAVLAL